MGILTIILGILFGIITGVGVALLITAMLFSASNNHGDTTGDFHTFTGQGTLHFIDKQNLKR